MVWCVCVWCGVVCIYGVMWCVYMVWCGVCVHGVVCVCVCVHGVVCVCTWYGVVCVHGVVWYIKIGHISINLKKGHHSHPTTPPHPRG